MWLSDSLVWDKRMQLSVYCKINHAIWTKIKFVMHFSVCFSITKFLRRRLRLVVLRLKEAGRRKTWLPLYQSTLSTLVLRTTQSQKDVSCAVAIKSGPLHRATFGLKDSGSWCPYWFGCLNIGLCTLIASCPAPKLLNVILCRFHDLKIYIVLPSKYQSFLTNKCTLY
jgi:hypothetical protein